jgi:hypothetical protein
VVHLLFLGVVVVVVVPEQVLVLFALAHASIVALFGVAGRVLPRGLPPSTGGPPPGNGPTAPPARRGRPRGFRAVLAGPFLPPPRRESARCFGPEGPVSGCAGSLGPIGSFSGG